MGRVRRVCEMGDETMGFRICNNLVEKGARISISLGEGGGEIAGR